MTFKKDDEALAETSEEPSAKPASHDTPNPPAFMKFMLSNWKVPKSKLPAPIKNSAAFRARRRRLSALFPGETLVIPTGHEKVRANDTHYRFRPSSEFYYYTGNVEPDCVLVLEPSGPSGHRDVLYVEPNPGRTSPTFFTDRAKGELWVGPRLGVAQSRARFGVDECRALESFDERLRTLTGPFRVMRGFSEAADSALADRGATDQAKRDAELATACSEMRLLKDAVEVKELQAAIDSTLRGFEDVIAALPYSRTERYVEGVFNMRARIEGNDVGYGTIAASGSHACVLHWTRNDGALGPRDLLLLDAGVEGNSLYTADITRTIPIAGKFSPAQREIYELVHAAQAAAFEAVRPGNDFMEPNRRAMQVLARGLEKLGILNSAEEALRDENQFYKRYSLHNVSHMLGLDVHDCAKARQEVYKFGKLEAGMVLTVEPGLYFQLDDQTVPSKYRGIGVRIEDDVLVTKSGYRNLSSHIPSRLEEVEKWIAKIWKSAGHKKKRS